MKKRGKKRMLVITIGVLLLAIVSITVFFNSSYSKTRAEFSELTDSLLTGMPNERSVFTEADMVDLPLSVQKYFRYCGYIGTPRMSFMVAAYQDIDFIFGKDKPTIKIDYTQYNFVNEPNRIAYIDSSMYGIPFEGLDSYTAGNGTMKGVLAKLFTLFHQIGGTMDQASLATFLSECLIIPNAALQDYIVWEEIDALHAKATISYHGGTASGIFAFNKDGEMLSFTTDDREATTADGTSEKVSWSAVLSDYKETEGIKRPTGFQAIWHYDDGDLLYFDGKGVAIEFDYEQMN